MVIYLFMKINSRMWFVEHLVALWIANLCWWLSMKETYPTRGIHVGIAHIHLCSKKPKVNFVLYLPNVFQCLFTRNMGNLCKSKGKQENVRFLKMNKPYSHVIHIIHVWLWSMWLGKGNALPSTTFYKKRWFHAVPNRDKLYRRYISRTICLNGIFFSPLVYYTFGSFFLPSCCSTIFWKWFIVYSFGWCKQHLEINNEHGRRILRPFCLYSKLLVNLYPIRAIPLECGWKRWNTIVNSL